MTQQRSSGILFHITSLPGAYGIGSLGKSAQNFIDFLYEAKQKNWQIFPLGPTGFGDSPYQTFSAFAGNPLLIDLENLVEVGLLSPALLQNPPAFPDDKVDYGAIIPFKEKLLRKAYQNFKIIDSFASFCEKESYWLDDYSLFMALKEHFNGASWVQWDDAVKRRQKDIIENFKIALQDEIRYHQFLQFVFFKQWKTIHHYAKNKGISIIGDIPIFIGLDSADAWANPDIFFFDQSCNPTVVAGVPPDGFSPTGQLWGNPLYRWSEMGKNNYEWWIQRFAKSLEMVDVIRVDHFIGFVNYWAVPATDDTAKNGVWEPGPGRKIFDAVKEKLGELPIIAEDLGVITPDVIKLRETFDFPGMKILQFAFYNGMDSDFLPHHYTRNCVVYTGTHDNETTRGWYSNAPDDVRKFANEYLNFDGSESEFSWKLIETAWKSRADLAIVPLQDVLNLDNSARMNFPGTANGNWQWRARKEDITKELAEKLASITQRYLR